jgi:hypothetical protein
LQAPWSAAHPGMHICGKDQALIRSKWRGRSDGLRHMKPDELDLYTKVAVGQLSANAAMIEAGFRKQPSIFASDQHQERPK